MGTNYYLMNKTEQTKDEVSQKIKDLAQEALTKLKALTSVSSYEAYKIEQAFTDVTPEKDMIHIGKNSSGWRFTFSEEVGSIAKLKEMFNDETMFIQNEYGREISLSEMEEIITETLNNPKRDGSGKELPESATRMDNHAYFTAEGYTVVRGEFS